jgi:predicted nuclease of restriction endonuclease-like (RecB) superfamily
LENAALLYDKVRTVLKKARSSAHNAVNAAMVQAYWQIGRLIVEDEQGGEERAEYGKGVLKELSRRLTIEFGKGYSIQTLRNIRQFYTTFPKRSALRSELTWTHYKYLMRVENEKAREWYINEAADQNWATRQLDRQISVFYYERILGSRDKDSVKQEADEKMASMEPSNFIRDPYVLEFLGLKDYPSLRESEIEQSIIDNLQEFLLELGKGFSFVARQKRIRLGDDDFYIDLVFYNFILKCFVLIDLKIGKLTYQDIGQMDGYIRMYEENLRREDDSPTIGLILCSEKNEAVARYSVLKESKQLFASRYMLYLPTEEELQHELERERRMIEERKCGDDLYLKDGED